MESGQARRLRTWCCSTPAGRTTPRRRDDERSGRDQISTRQFRMKLLLVRGLSLTGQGRGQPGAFRSISGSALNRHRADAGRRRRPRAAPALVDGARSTGKPIKADRPTGEKTDALEGFSPEPDRPARILGMGRRGVRWSRRPRPNIDGGKRRPRNRRADAQGSVRPQPDMARASCCR